MKNVISNNKGKSLLTVLLVLIGFILLRKNKISQEMKGGENNMDKITIQSVHPDMRTMVVVLTVSGTEFPKVLPFFDAANANVLKQQLQAFAAQCRSEIESLKTMIQNQDNANVPAVSADVQALAGQDIPLDNSASTSGSTTPGDGGTSGSTGSSTPATGTTPVDPSAGNTPPVDPNATPGV